MKFWKRSAGYLLKISGMMAGIGLLLFPVQVSDGCGPEYRSFYGYSFINLDIIRGGTTGFAPFILPFNSVSKFYEGQERIQTVDNVKEWRERFCNVPTMQDMYDVIYTASIEDMRLLRTAISSERIPIDYRLADNSFAQYLDRNKCYEAIDYLIFAKQCEPYVIASDAWEGPAAKQVAMQKLIDNGRKNFLKVESHYFRLRYAYQLIRLAHYAKDYQQVIDLHEYLMPKIDNDPSIIEHWIQGHYAGALTGLGRNVEAAYQYSIIFDKCPSKRESAFRSFRIKTDEEWRQCMLLCKDDHERAMLHVLRANAADAKAVEEMWEIYRLDPLNQNLELLIVSEIGKLEKDLLGYEFNTRREDNQRLHNIPRRRAGEYVIELQDFVRHVGKENKIARPDFWKIAEGYLELLAGNYYEAGKTFRVARTLVANDTLKEQLEVFELALEISAYTQVNDEVERNAFRLERRSDFFKKYKDFPNFMNDKLALLYRQTGHPGKAYLLRNSLRRLKPNPQLDALDDLIAVCEKPNPNLFEQELIKQGDSTILNDLLDIKATLLLGQFQLEAARETLRKMDRVNWNNYGLYSPFIERINDCVHCLLPDTVRFYNRGELIERLLDMEYDARAETNDNKAAWIFYRIGLAFYNMTYFGPSWRAADHFRSGASLSQRSLAGGGNVVPHPHFPSGNRENFDCSRALFYFERARTLARDPDLAARATFMAAKCEQNDYYVNRYQGAQRTYNYFDILAKNYSDTPFFIQVINECKYFQAYATK
jgi:hypothetical protein